jgi:hypothetical protein
VLEIADEAGFSNARIAADNDERPRSGNCFIEPVQE